MKLYPWEEAWSVMYPQDEDGLLHPWDEDDSHTLLEKSDLSLLSQSHSPAKIIHQEQSKI